MPITNHLVAASLLQINLQWELKLPITETLQRHKQFIRPLALLPHLEVFDGTFSPELMQVISAAPLEAYGPNDFAALAADESKRDVFMAAYRHSIVPRMRTAADLLMSKRHLLDYPRYHFRAPCPLAYVGKFRFGCHVFKIVWQFVLVPYNFKKRAKSSV